MEKTEKVKRLIYISPITNQRMENYINKTGYNRSEIVDQALREYLDRQEKEIEKYLNNK